MDKKDLKSNLHSNRTATEKKIRQLEKSGKAGKRYTAVISDIPFLITGLLSDVGWVVYIIFEIIYLRKYKFHYQDSTLMILDIASLVIMSILVMGIAVIIYLNKIHEKEIATRAQKNMGFGATVFSGLTAGLIGVVQLAFGAETECLIWIIIGGFATFVFGIPIYASFKKGIIYYNSDLI